MLRLKFPSSTKGRKRLSSYRTQRYIVMDIPWEGIRTLTHWVSWLLVVVQVPSRVWLSTVLWTVHARLPCPSPSLGVCSVFCPLSHDAIQPWPFPASGCFSNELALLNMWPKYGSFSFSISPSSEYSGLVSFRKDQVDLLAWLLLPCFCIPFLPWLTPV